MTPCIEWAKYRNPSGYGRRSVGGRMYLAHRYAWELEHGPVPEGLELDHVCRNRACINVEHLELVTHRENTLRGDTIPARYAARTHCDRGHAFDAENTAIRPGGARRCRECRRARQRVAA